MSLLTIDARTKKRNAAEARFRAYGLSAIVVAMIALAILLTSVVTAGISSFQQTYATVTVPLPEAKLDKSGVRDPAVMAKVTTIGYTSLLRDGLVQTLVDAGIETDLSDKDVGKMLSKEAAATVRDQVLANPDLIGGEVTLDLLMNGRIDGFFKGRVTMESAANDKNVSPEQLVLAQQMADAGIADTRLNWAFLTAPDASDQRPAVPSIVFGILGLAIFINFMEFNQSSPLVGGLVLTLMTLPTIIISTRASLKSVPPSIRDAALGVGASKMQSVFHHVLPLAAPGILTGTIIGLAQALGETAPLLLIGMVAFVREYPAAFTPEAGLFGEASTALPVQVYNWTQRADPGFVERASGAIITLLVFLFIMNAVAIILRRKFERRW